jgi:hypothetical protein
LAIEIPETRGYRAEKIALLGTKITNDQAKEPFHKRPFTCLHFLLQGGKLIDLIKREQGERFWCSLAQCSWVLGVFNWIFQINFLLFKRSVI